MRGSTDNMDSIIIPVKQNQPGSNGQKSIIEDYMSKHTIE